MDTNSIWIIALVIAFYIFKIITRKANNKAFQIGKYSPAGGAVCPRCQLPYSRHILSPNLLVGKLEKCPHCGKRAVVSRATSQKLSHAEERFNMQSNQTSAKPTTNDTDTLKKQLEDSKYDQ